MGINFNKKDLPKATERKSNAYKPDTGRKSTNAENAKKAAAVNTTIAQQKALVNSTIGCILANTVSNGVVNFVNYAAQATAPSQEEINEQYKEELVSSILEEVNQTENTELGKDLLKKLNATIAVKQDISEEELVERLTNYTKAYIANKESKPASQEAINGVKEILGNQTYSDSDLQKLAKRYELLTSAGKTTTEIQSDIEELAQGIQETNAFNAFSLQVKKGETPNELPLSEVTAAIKTGDLEQQKQAYINYAKREISVYDTNNDKKISLLEFEQEEKLQSEATLGAGNFDSFSTAVIFNTLDQNNDGYLDAKEVAAKTWGLARINEIYNQEVKTGDSISAKEVQTQAAGISGTVIDAGLISNNGTYTNTELELASKSMEERDAFHKALYGAYKTLEQ